VGALRLADKPGAASLGALFVQMPGQISLTQDRALQRPGQAPQTLNAIIKGRCPETEWSGHWACKYKSVVQLQLPVV